MSNAIVVASSTLVNGVLTVVLKVDANSAPVNNFDFSFLFDASKVSTMSTAPADIVSNMASPGNFLLNWAGLTPRNPGDVAFTLTVTLANPNDTTFTTKYSALINDGSMPDAIVELGDGLINAPVQGAVTLTGSPVEDLVLTADASALTDGDGLGSGGFTYHWLRDGVEASSTTTGSYTLGDADVGAQMSVRVTYTDGAGHIESRTSTALPVVTNVNDVPQGAVTITGRAAEGATLTANSTVTDADGMGALTYTWSAGGTVIASGASNTYKLTNNEVGKTVTVEASYTDGHGTAEHVAGAAPTDTVIANSRPTGAVTIDKPVPLQGDTLTVTNNLNDPDGNGTISYQWFADTTAIGTGTSVTLTQAEVNKTISVVASYTDGLGVPESVTALTSPVANVNDAPTGTVTITGTPIEDGTLTASDTLADIDGLGTISYQWFAGTTAFGTGSSVTLTQAQVGQAITVRASYTDAFTHAESVTSAATAVVANVQDPPQGAVTVTGTAEQGQTLTASNNITDEDGIPGAISYQWKAGGTAIAGATASTYTLTQADVTKAITVEASYTDGFGHAEKVTGTVPGTVANINDAPTGALTINQATPSKGQTLTFTNTVQDADGLGTFSFQWFQDGVAISGATGNTYVATTNDVTHAITVAGTYTDGFGHTETVTSAATAAVAPNTPPTGAVTITGTVQQGTTLTATHNLADADGLGTITFHWMSGTAEVGTGSTFTPTQAQVGKPLTVEARYTDGNGTPEVVPSAAQTVANVDDPLTGNVTIDKLTPAQGNTLTAQNTFADLDGLGTIAYQWFAGGTAISGATNSTLTLGQAQVGSVITVRATHTDALGGTGVRTSAPTAAVTNINDAPTGLPVISNTAPAQGQTLTVNTGAIADLDGLGAFSFVWMAGGVAITGATTNTLALTQAQVDKAITVQVSYTDGFGHAEKVVSAATSPVSNVNDAPTGAVTVEGARVVGMPLEARTATIADIDGLGTFSFQWMHGTTAIAGATGATYTPVTADAGQNISVKVNWTDLFGTHESLTSAAVGVVNEDTVTPLVAPGVTQLTGDGNGDGIVDSAQAAVVSAPLTGAGNSQVFVTLVADSSTTGGVNTGSSAVIQTLDQEATPTNIPGKLTAPLGLIDFTAATTQGQTETFTLFVVRGSLNVNGYWKQDAHGTWVNLASQPFGGATTNVGNKVRLDFKITDGGEFDADHTANGVIVDPAVIGAMPLSVVGYTPDVALTPTTHFFF